MVIADRRLLPVWPGTPPGVYQIAVSMYDSATMHELEPADEDLLLGPVRIVRGDWTAPPQPQHEVGANLDNKVRLLGYDMDGLPQPGGTLHLTLYWEALLSPDDNYTVFVHVVGEDGQIWGQRDSQPVTGFYPTSRWIEGELVRDQYDVPIRKKAPPGVYYLIVGMYQADNGQRLPVLSEEGTIVGDSVDLGTLWLGAP